MRPSLETAFHAELARRSAQRFQDAAARLPFLVDPAFRQMSGAGAGAASATGNPAQPQASPAR